MGWLPDSGGISLEISGGDGEIKSNQIWDWRKRKLLHTQKPFDKEGTGYFYPSAQSLCPYYLPENKRLYLSNGNSYFLGDADFALLLDSSFIGYRLFQKNNLQKLEIIKWQMDTGRSIFKITIDIPPGFKVNEDATSNYIAFSSDGKKVAISTDSNNPVDERIECRLLFFDIAGRKLIKDFPLIDSQISELEWTADNQTLISLNSQENGLYATHYEILKQGAITVKNMLGALEPIELSTYAFSSHGDLMAVAGIRDKIELWNLHTKQIERTFPSTGIAYLSFSPDDQTLAVGNNEGTITFYRLK